MIGCEQYYILISFHRIKTIVCIEYKHSCKIHVLLFILYYYIFVFNYLIDMFYYRGGWMFSSFFDWTPFNFFLIIFYYTLSISYMVLTCNVYYYCTWLGFDMLFFAGFRLFSPKVCLSRILSVLSQSMSSQDFVCSLPKYVFAGFRLFSPKVCLRRISFVLSQSMSSQDFVCSLQKYVFAGFCLFSPKVCLRRISFVLSQSMSSQDFVCSLPKYVFAGFYLFSPKVCLRRILSVLSQSMSSQDFVCSLPKYVFALFRLFLGVTGFLQCTSFHVHVSPLRLLLLRLYCNKYGGWWMNDFLFSIVQIHFFKFNFTVLFLYLIKYYLIMFIIIVFWLDSNRPLGLFFVPSLFFSILTPQFFTLFLCLILFLLFPFASVWENTRDQFHIFYDHTEWYLIVFAKRDDRNGRRVACQKLTKLIMIFIVVTGVLRPSWFTAIIFWI